MEPAGDDLQLLLRYARTRDEAAFAAVVRRHVDLVYTAAARRVGDRHLAEDVTQAVFVILAQRAHALPADRPLSGWLLATVRYAAANAMRMEARRRRHERGAAVPASAAVGGGAAAGACSANPSDVLVWQDVAARLDDAVVKLPAVDRRAVLLRFFEDRPIRDVAAELNLSEGAARQRLSRAVGKLRKRLERQGVGLSAVGVDGLAALLAAHAVCPAPPGVALGAVAAASGTGATTAGTAMTIAKGAITMMTWTKAKLAAAVVAVALMGGVGGALTMNRALAADDRPASPAAPAPKPAAPPRAADKPDDGGSGPGAAVVAAQPPVVVETVPRSGSTDVDAAATTELRATFSKPMQPGNFSWVRTGKDTFPETTGKARFEPDGVTCVLPVKLEPGKGYVIWLNKPPYDSFMDEDKRKAVPYLLVFATKP